MTLKDVDDLLNGLGTWFKTHSRVSKTPRREGDEIEIETPFKNRRGDNIQVYLTQKENGSLILSDGNIVSSDLSFDGVCIMSREIEEIAGCFGVSFDDPVLRCSCSPDDFSETLFRFVRCLTVIDSLAFTLGYARY